MSLINTPLLMAGGGYEITRSVRLRNSASAYFSRTYATSPTNNKINTFSGWVKRGTLGTLGYIFAAYDGSSALAAGIWFQNDKLWAEYGGPSGSGRITTTALYRDPSAWYHIVLAIDTTQATASNRVKLYVNGVQITAFDTATNPTLNLATAFTFPNANNRIGANWDNSGPFDGYLTEINFIDGQALTPSSFGFIDPSTGVWAPRKYTGTYGTNGFYVNFSDNSAATATTIGKDYSGNGNNWTPNNISVTAGVTYDSMIDTPTPFNDGGNGRGNYAIVNPLSKATSQTNVIDGNLYAIPTSGGSNWGTVFSSIAIPTSGKWYMEAVAQVYAGSGNNSSFGVVDSASFIPTNTAILYQFTTGEGFDGILAHLFNDYVAPISDGVQGTNVTGLTGTSINLMLALDVDNGKVYAGYNGTWLNSGNPAGGTGEVASRSFSATDVVAGNTAWNGTNDQSQYFNFGQRPFTYSVPTGFKTLNTQNLPQPTIPNGASYMAATLYTGTGAAQTISNAVNGVSFQPDFVWAKARSSAESHRLQDSVRGATLSLYSNLTNAEATEAQSITAFGSSGFTLGTGTPNTNAVTYVGWQWKAGGTPAVTNTNGSITSTVSANTTAGFSVVTASASGTSPVTVGHGLGVTPRLIIGKVRDVAGTNWYVYSSSFAATDYLVLNSTNGKATSSNIWDVAPTSSVFTVGNPQNGWAAGNAGSKLYVFYCFTEIPGYSKFGSYTGNGSSSGPFVYTEFRPRWILIKRTDSSPFSWCLVDSSRSPNNTSVNGGMQNTLFPNNSNAEDTGADICDGLSNGFRFYQGASSFNANGGTYIYAAFAENPFKFALAR
jgi:hypothetical protein